VGIGSDVRYGFRALRKSPVLTAVSLLTLSLGIAAGTVIFSVVNAVLLRPLPFSEPHRLVHFWGSAPEMGLPVVNYPDALLAYFRQRSRSFTRIGASNDIGPILTGAGEPEQLPGAVVTAGFFEVLGRAPLLGRVFLPEEEVPGRNQVTVLGYDLWQRRFGGDPGIVGRSVVLDGKPATVVGVMPSDFDFPPRAQVWVPLALDPQSLNCWCYSTIGRLAPGQTPAAASREISLLADDFWRDRKGEPRHEPGSTESPKSVTIAMPLARDMAGPVRTPLLVLLGAVGMVLLIACANVANLLLARATARGREIAVRGCLGASPWRIVRQLVVESLLLALAGGAVGLALAFGGARAISGLVAERAPYVRDVPLDPTVLLFSVGLTAVTVLVFGLAPAVRGARVDLHEAMKEGARGSRAARSRRLNEAFAIAQFALCVVLLVGAGLLLRSFRNLRAVDLGFHPGSVLVGRVSLPWPAYDEARARAFFPQLRDRLDGLPGIRSVGFTSSAPFSEGNNQQTFVVRGREPRAGEPTLVASVRSVSPGYFGSVGTPLRRGRAFGETDVESAPLVAIVDDALARQFWPDGMALDHELRLGDGPWRRIVGVVASVRHADPGARPDRYVYLPFAQAPSGEMDVVVRSAADPAALTASVRAAVHAVDPGLPLHHVHTLESAVDRSLGTRRLTNRLLLAFAMAALALATVGVYGVMALSVGHRVNEFGIRLALGAAPHDVLALVLRQGMRLVLAGVVLGLAAAGAVARMLASLLFEVRPIDPLTFGGVCATLLATSLAACYVPARRATRTDPVQALRYE